MTWTVGTYVAYLLIAVPITVWVASTLSRNGRVFLADVFESSPELADAVNQLLVVGFYLLNLGFVILYVRGGGEVADLTELFEALSVKIGVVMLVLGVIHFVNVMVFSSMRRRSRHDAARTQWMQQTPQPYAPTAPQR
ncbi:hypothetical protein [Aeromicrobium ginsengisoli]|uniref:Uncharacterized protein n=1 Tax=Aeromicrobium ginsengisoli TaxID=363867 RepID=A0A5M4FAU7_9ACTN|nr:hypothetical protein [Aeromicrobium ginsengisoli]KAA1395461.1 hypothetical protein ESP70_014990 [Aeromicrobium ginsengisoli]